jgi:RecA/RadA recombinase
MRALKEPQFDLIVLDSLAAMTNAVEAAGKLADANMGHTAKMLNKLFRIIPMELKRTNTALVVINQERKSFDPYGSPTYVLGGDGLKYGLSLAVRLSTTKAQRFPKAGPFKGHEVTAEVIKSKVNVPGRKATFPIFYLPGQTQ